MVEGRFMRQRCCWCGALLIDYDLFMMAVACPQGEKPLGWEAGSLMTVEGNASWREPDQGRLPDTFCGAAETAPISIAP